MDNLWPAIISQMPFVAVLIVIGAYFMRYVDRWVERIATGQSAMAQDRQQQILLVLERMAATSKQAEASLSGVIERNTEALKVSMANMSMLGTALAGLVEAQASNSQRLQNIEEHLLDHAKDVAARPCQQTKPQAGGKGPR